MSPPASAPRSGAVVGALLGALALLPVPSVSQAPGHGADGGVVFEAYRFNRPDETGIRSLSLLTLPFHGRIQLRPNLTVELGGAYARGTVERRDGAQSEIAGPTDTRLRLGLGFGRETRGSVEAIIVLPTGNASHTAEEALVAGAIAADLLPFRISHWGSGGAAGLGTSLRRSAGGTAFGVSGSYLVGRKFEPVDGQPFAYRPGDQLRMRATVDHLVGPASKLTFAFTAERHSEDALQGANLYRAGNRYNAVGAYSFSVPGRGAAMIYSGVFHRTEGAALLDWAIETPAQSLFLAGSGFRLPVRFGVLVPSADARLLRSGDGMGQGHVLGVGVMAELRAGNALFLPSVRGRLGRIVVREESESRISGLELGLTARFGEHRR